MSFSSHFVFSRKKKGSPGFYRSHFVLMANLYIQWLHYLAVVALSRIITSIDTVLPWWHSIDAMLVLPASMASPPVVPLAHHVGLKILHSLHQRCTLYQLHDIGLATPFFSRNGAASFLYGKETPFLTIPDLVLLPACRAARKMAAVLLLLEKPRVAPPARSNACGCCRRGGAFGSIIQRSGAWRKRGRPGVHRDARFHARVAVRARSACVRACFGRHVRDGTW